MQSFRISRAAQLLGVSDDTLRRWVDQGLLPTTDAVPAEIPGDALAARAVSVVVVFDYSLQKPVPVPEQARELLEPYLLESIS